MAKKTAETSTSIWNRLPSIVWVFIFVFGLIGVIATIFGIFYALSHFEGFGSILFLLAAWGTLRLISTPPSSEKNTVNSGIIMGIGITFFALMGMAVDQPGNPIYNQPLETLFCPEGTAMERGVDVTHPRAGETTVTQDFSCYDTETGELVEQIGMGKVMPVRFVEYVLIGYGLVALSNLYDRIKYRRMREA